MAIEKERLSKSAQRLQELEDLIAAKEAAMKKLKDGSFTKTLDLPVSNEYQFRYIIDGKLWENETHADKLVYNGYGTEQNSVIVL